MNSALIFVIGYIVGFVVGEVFTLKKFKKQIKPIVCGGDSYGEEQQEFEVPDDAET